jgi:DNA polymerase-3 subunit gamma/tau
MSDQAPRQTYRVLARKYRPATFADLIGQEAMVRTLANAFTIGRIAHAFILTGVRGVGKTSTARIIAKALNCVGPDGRGGSTVSPCGACEQCRAIAEGRAVDVIEMDAASHTGVDDVREITEAVRYAPAAARTKVYIIDEVHMLSRQAFNALLKTLEEPPPNVTFIFATTEARKVPVTVLSRCQRFDLRRVDSDVLIAHFGGIAKQEEVAVADAALALIARAAEGSVRDGLSLLDQAIAFADGEVSEAQVRDMLGLVDRAQVIDLFEYAMTGDAAGALGILRGQYDYGADPTVVLGDVLEFTHWLTRLKIAKSAADDLAATEAERVRGQEMAAKLSLPELTRTWQLLLKGLTETRDAPSPIDAAEMVLIRLAYAAGLPTPADLVRRLKDGAGVPAGHGEAAPPGRSAAAAPIATAAPAVSSEPSAGAAPAAGSAAGLATAPEAQLEAAAEGPAVESFRAAVELAREHREGTLYLHLRRNVHLVRFDGCQIEVRLTDDAPSSLPNDLAAFLTRVTKQRWVVSVATREPGEPTIEEQKNASAAGALADAAEHPLVKKALEIFPGAEIKVVRDLRPDVGAVGDAAAPQQSKTDGEPGA